MNWVEVALRVNADIADTIAEVMEDYAYQGVILERDDIPDVDGWDEINIPPANHYTLRAYLPAADVTELLKNKIRQQLVQFNVEQPVFRVVDEENWAEAWKKHYHPLRIGERIVVRPLWESVDLGPDDIEIALDPGMAFGTGTHPTTQLCLQALETAVSPGTAVLDLGCGSAILAIAAAKLGAGNVYAIDNDPVAMEAAAENVTQNGVADRITLDTGSLPEVKALNRQFDLALVNILARIIVPMAESGLGDVVKPGGTAIFSGLIRSQQDEVEAALKQAGLHTENRHFMGDWVLLEARRID